MPSLIMIPSASRLKLSSVKYSGFKKRSMKYSVSIVPEGNDLNFRVASLSMIAFE